MKTRVGGLAALLVVVLSIPFVVVASGQAARGERTVAYRLDEALKLDAKIGPVVIDNVRITNLGRGYGRGGFGPKPPQPSEASTTLRFAFDVNNPGEDWEVTFTVELLDKSGKLIDRFTKKENWEEEAEIYKVDHPILEYVVPMIADVKIMLNGRLD